MCALSNIDDIMENARNKAQMYLDVHVQSVLRDLHKRNPNHRFEFGQAMGIFYLTIFNIRHNRKMGELSYPSAINSRFDIPEIRQMFLDVDRVQEDHKIYVNACAYPL